MSTICSDNFDGGTGGSTLAGRTSSGGTLWSANIDSGHSGEAILYPTSGVSTKLGSKNSLPDSSALYFLNGTPPTADYGVDFSFEFGTNIARQSIGVLVRFQNTTVTAAPVYYAIWYNGVSTQWEMYRNTGPGIFIIGSLVKAYSPGVAPFTFRACGTTIELLESGVSILSVTDTNIVAAGHAGIIVPTCNTSFTNSAGWWITDFVANSNSCNAASAEFGLYFAGSGSFPGEDFTPIDYGLPTPVTVNNPIAGTEYAIGAVPVDLAGFLSSKMGNIKLRRSSGGSNMVLRGISLKYKKTQT